MREPSTAPSSYQAACRALLKDLSALELGRHNYPMAVEATLTHRRILLLGSCFSSAKYWRIAWGDAKDLDFGGIEEERGEENDIAGELGVYIDAVRHFHSPRYGNWPSTWREAKPSHRARPHPVAVHHVRPTRIEARPRGVRL